MTGCFHDTVSAHEFKVTDDDFAAAIKGFEPFGEAAEVVVAAKIIVKLVDDKLIIHQVHLIAANI